MSTVKLITRKSNDLNFGDVVELDLKLAEDVNVIGVVRSDFEVEENGDRRVSDGLDTVMSIEDINNLQGRLLTLVEAFITDPEQRKAAKDLVKQNTWSWYTERMDGLSRAWRFNKGYETHEPGKFTEVQ